MTALVIEPSTARLNDGHTLLYVTPPDRNLDRVADLDRRFAEYGGHAIRLAGMLSRIAIDIAGALEASRIDHCCGRELYRDDRDRGAEVVHAWRHGCGAALLNCDRHMKHLLEHAELPYLEVCVPRNRLRAWTARLDRAIDDVVNLDRRTLTTSPDDY